MTNPTPHAGEEADMPSDAAAPAHAIRTALADPINATFLTAQMRPMRPPAEPSNAAAGGAGA